MAVPSPEELLLAQIIKENQERPSVQDIAGIGAAGGAIGGVLAGIPVHAIGKGIGNMTGRNRLMKPGARMAGGLLGAIVGDALGLSLGLTLGLKLGDNEGDHDGDNEGESLGDCDGELLGLVLGEFDGEVEGDALGDRDPLARLGGPRPDAAEFADKFAEGGDADEDGTAALEKLLEPMLWRALAAHTACTKRSIRPMMYRSRSNRARSTSCSCFAERCSAIWHTARPTWRESCCAPTPSALATSSALTATGGSARVATWTAAPEGFAGLVRVP